jgi:hypothetical protein
MRDKLIPLRFNDMLSVDVSGTPVTSVIFREHLRHFSAAIRNWPGCHRSRAVKFKVHRRPRKRGSPATICLLGCALFSIPNFINHVNWIAQYFVCRVALLAQQFD